MPPTTLVTGFGPFGRVASNPTQRLVEHLERTRCDRHDITALVLPVSFARAAAAVATALAQGRFDYAVLTGVAVGADAIRVESFARNLSAARLADCDGCAPEGVPVILDAPERLPSTVDVGRIALALGEEGLPAVVSADAGGYVCNHTYYAALHTVGRLGLPTRCVFLHVPADEHALARPDACPAMPFADMLRALRIALGALAGPAQAPPEIG